MSASRRRGRRGELWDAVYERALVPVRVLLTAGAVALIIKGLGLDLEHAIFTGIAFLVIAIAFLAMRGGGASTAWLPDRHHDRDGSRLEVASLSWALLGRGGRVSEGALRRLREVAAGRLARHQLDLGAAWHAEQIKALLGDTAWAVLTTRGHMPNRREFELTVRALERADPHPDNPLRRR